MSANSKAEKRQLKTKPQKPSPDFPLFPHASGKWAKKINGKLYYFGRWDDPNGALSEYRESRRSIEVDGLPATAAAPGLLTVRDAVNHFLTAKQRKLDCGDISHRTFAEYKTTSRRIVTYFGKRTNLLSLAPADFDRYRELIAATRNPTGVGNEVTRVRTILSYAFKADLIDRPVRFGPVFVRPPMKQRRIQAFNSPKRLFRPDQLRLLLDEVGIHLRAMCLLGVNGGYDNAGCAELPFEAVDLANGWITYFRPKTGVVRRTPLWPETIEAMQTSLSRRPVADGEDAARRFFLTPAGRPWNKGNSDSKITRYVSSALKRLHLHQKGMSFYWLRSTFCTIAEQTGDRDAIKLIMGHSDNSVTAVYIQEFPDERLRKVADHVRQWLFNDAKK